MNLLSIQSHVAYGHVGNSAATFALQRLGVDVWPVHTVQFSNHPGYGDWKGAVFDADLVHDIIDGIEKRGVLGECDGVLSGYLGSVEIGAAVLDAVARVKRANPASQYCCDPVIGDVEQGIFVRAGIPEFLRDHAVPEANMLTPNQFELNYLTGCNDSTLAGLLAAVDSLHARGPRIVVVTSVNTDETPANCIDVIASDQNERYRVRTPRLEAVANGCGDLIAALLMAHELQSGSLADALSQSVSTVFGILGCTAEAGSCEILIVPAQEELVHPSRVFKATRL